MVIELQQLVRNTRAVGRFGPLKANRPGAGTPRRVVPGRTNGNYAIQSTRAYRT